MFDAILSLQEKSISRPTTSPSLSPSPSPSIEQPLQGEQIGKSEFVQQLEDFVQSVDQGQHVAGEKLTDVVNGESHDLHGTLIEANKAGIQLRLMVSLRDKAIEAYREVMRMGA